MLLAPRVPRQFLCTIGLIIGISSISRVAIADKESLTKLIAVKQVARYSVIQPRPSSGQQDLLAVALPLRVPNEITTVGGAVEYAIRDSDYRLVASDQLTTGVNDMLKLPLPKAHRQFQPLPLKDVINLLAGPAFVPVHDPVHRLLAFVPCCNKPADSAIPKSPDNDARYCVHFDGQIIQRDLTGHTGEEDSADE
jgi:conjugative transfer region protein (TIGR03748 family)